MLRTLLQRETLRGSISPGLVTAHRPFPTGVEIRLHSSPRNPLGYQSKKVAPDTQQKNSIQLQWRQNFLPPPTTQRTRLLPATNPSYHAYRRCLNQTFVSFISLLTLSTGNLPRQKRKNKIV